MKTVFAVSSIVLLLGATACKENPFVKKGNPFAGIPTSVLKDTTTVEIPEKEFKFDTINQGDTVLHTFQIKNTGDKNLIIGNAFGSCGCTVPEYPKDPIAPGATADIKVRFNSAGKEGEQHKSVTLQINTVSHEEKVFLTGFVIAPKKDK
ncbi:MAG TPA: DUF1573 domain-containing protein [Chitinophagales bacterium]